MTAASCCTRGAAPRSTSRATHSHLDFTRRRRQLLVRHRDQRRGELRPPYGPWACNPTGALGRATQEPAHEGVGNPSAPSAPYAPERLPGSCPERAGEARTRAACGHAGGGRRASRSGDVSLQVPMTKPLPLMLRFGPVPCPVPAQPRYFPTHRPAGPGKCGPPDDRSSSERGMLGDRYPRSSSPSGGTPGQAVWSRRRTRSQALPMALGSSRRRRCGSGLRTPPPLQRRSHPFTLSFTRHPKSWSPRPNRHTSRLAPSATGPVCGSPHIRDIRDIKRNERSKRTTAARVA